MYSTNQKIAIIRYFAGLEISTYDSDVQMLEVLIGRILPQLIRRRASLNAQGSIQIIKDICERQFALFLAEGLESQD